MKFFQAREYDAGASPTHQESQHGAEDSWTSSTNFEEYFEMLHDLK
jgi:hypothetical protein